jgi:hypothetical protein
MYTSTFYVCTQDFVGIFFYVACIKRTKCPLSIHVRASKFSFLQGTQKIFFSPENLCATIRCLDIRVKFYFRFFFLHFKFCFHALGSTHEPIWISLVYLLAYIDSTYHVRVLWCAT